MVGMRSDRVRARARDLLETAYPVPENTEAQRLRELANNYILEAERTRGGGQRSRGQIR